MRGCGLPGVCTFSVTTSKCEFVKFCSLEIVFHPSLSRTSLLRFTLRSVEAAVSAAIYRSRATRPPLQLKPGIFASELSVSLRSLAKAHQCCDAQRANGERRKH